MHNTQILIDDNAVQPDVVPSREYESALSIQQLLDQSLSRLIHSIIKFVQLENKVNRVDGLIIGTGEADFTKGNTQYNLHVKDKVFQLIDVPGIEGNESRYVHLVKDAIAKAHMVVYVNGTNKKPETVTAKKIQSYLEYGTKVYPLINVRGFSDHYEFEEDRQSLDQHGGASGALSQTIDVLSAVLGKDVLIKGHCVQGLLAFSALAYDDGSKCSTIVPARNLDLGVAQQEFFDAFPTRQDMRTFSQIDAVARTIRSKVTTFQQDIVESNKGKVREILGQYLQVLQEQLANHKSFMKKTEPEFEKCIVASKNAISEFRRRMANTRRNHVNTLFNELLEASDNIVEEDFGDKDAISRRIQQEYKKRSTKVEKKVRKDIDESVKVLQQQMLQAVSRLMEDIEHVVFQQRATLSGSGSLSFGSDMVLGYDLGLRDFGSLVAKIGSYASTGAAIGASFMGIGAIPGAVIGAVVGAIMFAYGLFTSKASKIRKAQGKVREQLELERDKALDDVAVEVRKLVTSVTKELEGDLLKKINNMQAALLQPISIFEAQITRVTKLKNQLENMPYGTIQAVQP